MSGIRLDRHTTPLVPEWATVERMVLLAGDSKTDDEFTPWVLSHVGGRSVAEMVADVDALWDIATFIRVNWKALFMTDGHARLDAWGIAERRAGALDAIADRLLHPTLVAAWHAQHDDIADVMGVEG